MSNGLLVCTPIEHGQDGLKTPSPQLFNEGSVPQDLAATGKSRIPVRSTYSYLKAPVSGELGGEIWSSAGGRRLEYMEASLNLGAGDEEYPSPSLV